jgi:hypothetical protein
MDLDCCFAVLVFRTRRHVLVCGNGRSARRLLFDPYGLRLSLKVVLAKIFDFAIFDDNPISGHRQI